MKRRTPPWLRMTTVLTAGVAASLLIPMAAAAAPSGEGSHPVSRDGAILRADCLDPDVRLTVEESRLVARLPHPEDPGRLNPTTFAEDMIAGGGFEDVGPAVVARLCAEPDPAAVERVAERAGRALWRAAVARVQSTGDVRGHLPRGDDRPLYWTRLQVTAALRQWQPAQGLSADRREAIIETFEKASRGMTGIAFPRGQETGRVLVSGFDPFTLDGGDAGDAEGAAGNNIRHGNPSGASALALDGTTHIGADGRRHTVRAYLLPVNYTEFTAGWVEDTVGPHMRPGPRSLTASFTVSQGREGRFDLEVWNGRYRGVRPGNDASLPCPPVDGAPQTARTNPGCTVTVSPRWGGPRAFDLHDPPQWTEASFPYAAMIDGDTGAGTTPPPGSAWSAGGGFPVVRNTAFTEFPSCDDAQTVARNTPPEGSIHPAQPGTPPSEGSCAYAGGGGNYLSNESGYRNTLLRDRLGRDIPAGHIHTPVMQHFAPHNRFAPTDASFEAWRDAIVGQTIALVVAGASQPSE